MNELPNLPTYLFEPSLSGLLSLILTVLLPLVAGLLMKASWGSGVKATILLFLSAVKAFVEAWLDSVNNHSPFNAWLVGYAIAVNFGIAVVSYFGLWRKTGVQQAVINGGIVKD